jgi:hypothetical protein
VNSCSVRLYLQGYCNLGFPVDKCAFACTHNTYTHMCTYVHIQTKRHTHMCTHCCVKHAFYRRPSCMSCSTPHVSTHVPHTKARAHEQTQNTQTHKLHTHASHTRITHKLRTHTHTHFACHSHAANELHV